LSSYKAGCVDAARYRVPCTEVYWGWGDGFLSPSNDCLNQLDGSKSCGILQAGAGVWEDALPCNMAFA